MAMSTSQMAYAIAKDTTLTLRVESMVRSKLATATVTPTERYLLRRDTGLPVDELMWALSANATVRNAVATQMQTEPDIAVAIDNGVPDGDLEYILLQELTCLQ